MVEAGTFTWMGLYTKEIGKMISNMGKELRNGLMGLSIQETILMVKSTGTGILIGQMVPHT